MAEERKSIDSPNSGTGMFFLPLALHRCSFSRKMLEVAQGMEYIHSEGVVHGDLRGVRYLKHALLKC